ncbi:MAG TPA: hypothetical protein PKA33_13915 [Amaricoccus sp.]|uniref:hypothetical protein n=1 Tax=Amaricoccus sp. TaxID=1872485 RepID=UPI002BD0DA03|nr:hypothetical protein [Amaricoccus sp.]HMQ93646.1 hypothetical protein [Amaricoccus sp.]HMR53495.1 hypothetical protein [Amaricoccus sp.]HMR60578.1 hypothetical protein [Amaricoccus sp.]HMU00447.1 hypothetical protein [Amaricoccus sp.]
MKREIGITVSAMMIAVGLGSPVAAEPPTLDQLTEIAGLLADNDIAALRAFLLQHPELLEGDATLAGLLRDFMDSSGDMTTFLAFEPDLRDALGQSGVTDGPPVSRGANDPVVETLY